MSLVICRGCNKEFEAISVDKLGRSYKARRFYCTTECRSAHYISSGKHKYSHIKMYYGLSEFQYNALISAQNGLCLVCEKPLNGKISVDHDHACCPTIYTCGKCVRGLLHEKCNIGLGAFDDDPERLRKAARYLEVSKAMQPFKVNLEEAIKFSKIWTHKGVYIPLSDADCQFATDFSNVVLRNFIQMCQEQAQQEAELNKPKKLIIEGV